MSGLILALPSKGRLKPQAEGWLSEAGFSLEVEGGERGYRATLKGLGLNKMHRTRELQDTPAIRGMVSSIPHLVRIVEEKN